MVEEIRSGNGFTFTAYDGEGETGHARPAEKGEGLEQQLEDARMRNIALDTLIDVAEEKLKINIRKKPGAKQ